jgi:hypothetical protein
MPTERQMDMKLIVAFCNFAKVPKNDNNDNWLYSFAYKYDSVFKQEDTLSL